jgi:hypothetical protein
LAYERLSSGKKQQREIRDAWFDHMEKSMEASSGIEPE